ncbi:hypothetical protein SUGI_0177580 [Cryptomeria japonica]|nr:hypothetical protein SUGI_0177580 [Cryptomeria japonica]
MSYIKEQDDADMRSNKSKSNAHCLANKRSKRPSGLTQPADPHSFMPMLPSSNPENVSVSRERGPLDKALKNDIRYVVDCSIARYIYGNRLPFNIVRSPYWRDHPL